MNDTDLNQIIIAPMLCNLSTIVVYRNNSEEVVVNINKKSKTFTSNKKLNTDEVDFIQNNYL
jgi:hypothetical protein